MKPEKQLIIGQKAKQKLNKLQQTFNRLVKKLEKMRLEKEKTAKVLSEKLDFYGKHLHPLEEKAATKHKQTAKLFYAYHQKNKIILSNADSEALIEIMASQISEYLKFSREGLDDELKEIFEFVEGENYDDVAESDFQAMKDDMAETFAGMGFEVDLDDFTSDMSDADMMRKLMETLGEVKEQAETKFVEEELKRKKTKKQLEKEAREKEVEEAKNKNISGIYKQLAKIFHPDLEQDTERKSEKENLMKELTLAYKNGDLHTLLRLELEWLHKEEDNLDKLSNDKLKIYNDALKEQIEEIETEIEMSIEHPRFFPLKKYANMFGIESVNLKHEQKKLEDKLYWMESDIVNLTGKNAGKEFKKVIGIVKKQLKQKPMMNFDFLEELFG